MAFNFNLRSKSNKQFKILLKKKTFNSLVFTHNLVTAWLNNPVSILEKSRKVTDNKGFHLCCL